MKQIGDLHTIGQAGEQILVEYSLNGEPLMLWKEHKQTLMQDIQEKTTKSGNITT